eukprot:12420247-Karenia_brevis.AAC.1
MDQQIYLAPDKSRKQTRLEFHLRRGKKILEQMCDKKVFTNKFKGLLSANYKKVLEISCDVEEEDPTIKISPTAHTTLGVSVEQLNEFKVQLTTDAESTEFWQCL